MVAYNYYLGPWEWDISEPSQPHWRAPVGTMGLIDLRSNPDQALAGSFGNHPHGFFAVNGTLDSSYDLLGGGDLREMSLSAGMKSTWLALLGTAIQGTNLVDGLFDHLTARSDPTGDTPTMPLVPTVRGNLDLYLGGHSLVKRERFKFGVDSHTNRLTDLFHLQYRQNRADAEAGKIPERHEDRILDYWLDKYRVDKADPASWRRFVPPEMRSRHPGPLRHKTTITDDFNRADESLDASANWTEVVGSQWSVLSNEYETGENKFITNVSARHEGALSSDDHYCKFDVTYLGSSNCYPNSCCRFASGAETYYFGYISTSRFTDDQIYKMVAGTPTSLAGVASPGSNRTAPYETELKVDGSSLEIFEDAVSLLTTTDTAITGNVRCGIYGRGDEADSKGDNFEAADLAVGGGSILPQITQAYMRCNA